MNSNSYANILDMNEKAILHKLKKILRMKRITISDVVLVNYIRNNHVSGFIGVEQINRMIQECMNIEDNNNKVKNNRPEIVQEMIQEEVIEDSNINTNDVDEQKETPPQTIAQSIVANIQSTVPTRELREELIYIKGISGINFTNTFNLNKTYNNVESLELMSGYVNDDRSTIETNFWENTTEVYDGGAAASSQVVIGTQEVLTITTDDTKGVIVVGDKVIQDTTGATGFVEEILSTTTFKLRNIKSASNGTVWHATNAVKFYRNIVHSGGAAAGDQVEIGINDILTITNVDTNGNIKVGDKVIQNTTGATGIVDVILSSTRFRLRNIKSGGGPTVWHGTNAVNFSRNTGIIPTSVHGSIGPVPFLWLDIVEPTIRNYAHYVNYSRSEYAAPSSCDCGLSSCNKCGISGVGFTDCSPGGTFMVTLKQINSIGIDDIDTTATPANLVYIVDKGEYEKKFNQLISMSKLKINLKNINGRMLWGCEACGLGNRSVKTSNLLRWEFIFKVKYYVNVLENNFLFQN